MHRVGGGHLLPKGIVDEICDDHDRILVCLDDLIDSKVCVLADIQGLFVIIGAHHLAEEQTLYAALTSSQPQTVGQAHVFHLVLDDLVHSIEGDHGPGRSLKYELLLLHHLLRLHFDSEESDMLERLVETYSIEAQIDLGHRYRSEFIGTERELRSAVQHGQTSRSTKRPRLSGIGA